MFKGTSEWREAREVCSARPRPSSQSRSELTLPRRAAFSGAEWVRAEAHTRLAL